MRDEVSECFRAIRENRPDLSEERLDRTRSLMEQAIPDCSVTEYEPLFSSLSLPDPDDRHVLAAAIRAGAQVIVTFNLDDFPSEALGVCGGSRRSIRTSSCSISSSLPRARSARR
ncbi:MAG: PIN domain-containing protein [Candidatus Schekmanbacteria bacterium]|nr:PIN domain-containing protein [Candidatus Schekmanbacteria bacterium]